MTENKSYPDKLMAVFEPLDDEWQSTTRSIRIDGTVTSVRLENFYWRVVGDIARRNGLQVPQLMTSLSKAAKSGETKHSNFTSFIRVCCGRYLDAEISRVTGEEGGHGDESSASDATEFSDTANRAAPTQSAQAQNMNPGSTASVLGIQTTTADRSPNYLDKGPDNGKGNLESIR